MFLFILDSLGNGELLVILVAALIFFGPRKLPQLSRTVGKSLTEFRRASEDFKRTWAQEVALERDDTRTIASPAIVPVNASVTGNAVHRNPGSAVSVQGSPEVVENAFEASRDSNLPVSEVEKPEPSSEPLRKQDWL